MQDFSEKIQKTDTKLIYFNHHLLVCVVMSFCGDPDLCLHFLIFSLFCCVWRLQGIGL